MLRAVVLLCPILLSAAEPTVRLPSNLHAEGIPAIPAALLERLDQYTAGRTAAFQGWNPRQREMLVLTRFANTNQVHRIGMPMGAREQITFRRDRVLSASYRPGNSEQVLYRADSGGGEWYQFYLMDFACGCTRMLTDGKSRNDYPVWSRDGAQLAFSSTMRTGADSDIYVRNPDDSSPPKLVLQGRGGGWHPLDWTADGRSLLVAEERSVTDSSLHIVDLASGRSRQITAGTGDAWNSAVFSPDGKRIYVSTDKDSDWMRLAAIDAGSGQVTFLRPGARWDVSDHALSPDGRRLAYLTNEDGASVLHVWDTTTDRDVTVPKLPYGVITNPKWDSTGREVGFSLVTARHPMDVFSVDVAAGAVHRWTRSETGSIEPRHARDPELAHWKSFDGRMISGFLYSPPEKFAGGPRPVIINIHGGPEGQSRPTYLGAGGYYRDELGIAILYPNVRGSTGYGKQFVSLDDGVHREDAVKDIGALLDWIATRKDLDATRVMVTGGSYGGYMTLASMTHYNSRIRCAVEAVGISNWITFLEHTEAYRRDLRRVEYGDERDPKMRDFLSTISPLSNVSRIRKPMFVIAGRNDPRVPYTEGQQIVEALRKQRTPTWFLLADDEGHGFSKKGNQDIQTAATVLFIEQYLLR
ncbi:MAG: S9 family peptidase [Bryobacterales bacterium]|nr:S9 family peptidase [Bryobacterales bacterium]